MNLIIFFLQCFLSLLLCYSSTVSVYLSFFKKNHFDCLTVFFVLTIISFSLFSLWQIYNTAKRLFKKQTSKVISKRKNPIEEFQKNKKLLALSALCFISSLTGFFTAYNQYHFRGLSGAEVHQFFSSTLNTPIIEVSYKQQQPPLDYYFSSFSNELWGMNKFSVRFHTMMFYLILSLILPLMFWFLCSSLWAVIIGFLLFSINHAIIFHSADGRPLSLSLLTGSLFLFFYMCYCKNNQSKKQSLFFPVLSSQYLFIMSIGLQPVIFIASLFLSSFHLLFKGKKPIFKKLFLSHILTGLFALPIYIKMLSFGQDAYKIKIFSLETINSYIENYNVLDLFKKYFYPFYEQLTPFVLLLVLGLTVLTLTQRKISILTTQVVTALIIFPLLFDFIFEFMINWEIVHWYFIVYSLLFIFFCALAFDNIFSYLQRKFKNKKNFFTIYLSLIPIGLLFLINCYFQISFIKQKTHYWRQSFFPYDNSTEKVYNYLKKEGSSSDLAVEISLTPIPFYRSVKIKVLKPFYHDPNHHPIIVNYFLQTTNTPPFFYEKPGDEIPYTEWENIKKKKTRKIFFITLNQRDKEDKARSVLSEFIRETKIENFSIFEWTLKTKNHEEEYKNFLNHLIEKTPKKYQAVLYETLLYYACKNKNKVRFVHLLKKYRELEPFLNEFIDKIKLPSHFALRRRADYFENGDYCHPNKKD